ncbi:hypothetical protein BH20ACT5_BH20ACT5_18320 [soil metagenome]
MTGPCLDAHLGALRSLERSVREIIHRAQMTRMHALLEDVSGVRLERFWFRLLLVLEEAEPRRPRELAQLLAVTPAQISRAVTSLETAGLVRREAIEQDRRGSLIDLTRAGRDAVEQMLAAASTVFDAVVAGWSPADIEVLEALMRRWATDLTRYTDELIAHPDEVTAEVRAAHDRGLSG